MDMDQQEKELSEAPSNMEKVPIDIERGWELRDDGRDVRQHCLGDQAQEEPQEAYTALWNLIRNKGHYVATTVTDEVVYDMDSDDGRVVAPYGNIRWRQRSKACTKDIWEEGEVSDDIRPHCRALLASNTVDAEIYIEEGYLPRWEAYKKWQTGILGRRLVILKLGEEFKMPTVMRWPSEKIGLFNQRSVFYRIRETFYQMLKEMGERAAGIQAGPVAFIRGLAEDQEEYRSYLIAIMSC